MSDLNTIYLQGRLTKGAVSSVLTNGTTLLKLSIATNKDYLDRNRNEWVKQTHFFEVAYYGDAAKKNEQEFTKGREVLVEGELRQSTWEKDGKKYSAVEIRASRVRPLRRPGEGKRIADSQAGGNYYPAASDMPDSDDMPDDTPAF